MKSIRIISYLTILGLVLWGIINPNGIRAAAANNKWSLAFVEHFYTENSTMPKIINPPSSHPHAKLLLAREAIKSGNDSLALEYVTPFIGPDNPMMTNAYAEIAYRQENYTEAIRAWKMAGNINALHKAMYELLDKELVEAALYANQSRYNLDKESAAASLAGLYVSQNDFPSALEVLDQSMYEFPDSSKYQTWLRMKSEIKLTQADFFLSKSSFIEAESAYQSSVTINPNNWLAWRKFGWFHYKINRDVESAKMCFQEEIKAKPESGEGQFDLANLYAAGENFELANYWFMRAIEIKPDSIYWLTTYANFLAEYQELSKAIEIYEYVLQTNPDYADGFYSAAKVYAQDNQPEKAISAIERALQLMNPPSLRYYLLAGTLYEKNGYKEEALNAYANALLIDSKNQEALLAKKRLTE